MNIMIKTTVALALAIALLSFGVLPAYATEQIRMPAPILTFGSIALRQGSSGQSVTNLQIVLNNFNGAGLAADGRFGLKTKSAVQAFQATKKLNPDGVVGSATKEALLEVQGGLDPGVCCFPRFPTHLDLTRSNTQQNYQLERSGTITLTLGNPGDGGYSFNAPTYNPNILQLVNHYHTPPSPGTGVDVGIIGNWGTDTWNFKAIGQGSTLLQVTASRGWQGVPSTMFSSTIFVDPSIIY